MVLTRNFLATVACTFLLACESSNGPYAPGGNFCPLNTGDKLQLIDLADSATQMYTVLGHARRQDGTYVFAIEQKVGTIYTDTSYRFVRDGYLLTTQLDSINWFSLPGNPYAEARIAKVSPIDGDRWTYTLSSVDTIFITARYIPSLTTMYGTTLNVVALTSTHSIGGQEYSSGPSYYGDLLGLIGYDADFVGIHIQWRASYIKCGTTEMGSPWPDRNGLPM